MSERTAIDVRHNEIAREICETVDAGGYWTDEIEKALRLEYERGEATRDERIRELELTCESQRIANEALHELHAEILKKLEAEITELYAFIESPHFKRFRLFCNWCDGLQGPTVSSREEAKAQTDAHEAICPNSPYRGLEAERDNLLDLIRQSVVRDFATGEVAYGKYDYSGNFIAPKTLPSITKLEGLVEELRSALTDASVTLDEIATAGKKWDYPNVRTKLKAALAHATTGAGS